MERAVVSTPSGAGGLGLEPGKQIWVGESAAEFAEGILALLADGDRRRAMALQGRRMVEREFGWRAMGEKQAELWKKL